VYGSPASVSVMACVSLVECLDLGGVRDRDRALDGWTLAL
jgi:hypothetical protein